MYETGTIGRNFLSLNPPSTPLGEFPVAKENNSCATVLFSCENCSMSNTENIHINNLGLLTRFSRQRGVEYMWLTL